MRIHVCTDQVSIAAIAGHEEVASRVVPERHPCYRSASTWSAAFELDLDRAHLLVKRERVGITGVRNQVQARVLGHDDGCAGVALRHTGDARECSTTSCTMISATACPRRRVGVPKR